MNVYPLLLDAAGEPIAQIDDFSTASWDRVLIGVDNFKIALSSTSRYAAMIQPDMIVLVPDAPKPSYIVEQIAVSIRGTDNVMEVSGRSVDLILDDRGRLTIPAPGSDFDEYIEMPVETLMKTMVNRHAGSDAAAARQVPGLVVAPDEAQGSVVTVQARNQPVLEWLEALAAYDYIGWEINYDTDTGLHTFDVIIGEDKADTVFLDVAFDSITAMEWYRTAAELATYAIVGGAGEGAARTLVEGYPGDTEPTGLARREIFIDQGSSDDVRSLALAGDAALGEASRQESFRVDIAQDGPYQYRRDWDLGDIVLVRDERWGIESAAKIVKVTASITESSLRPNISVELGRPAPALARRITKELRRLVERKGTQ